MTRASGVFERNWASDQDVGVGKQINSIPLIRSEFWRFIAGNLMRRLRHSVSCRAFSFGIWPISRRSARTEESGISILTSERLSRRMQEEVFMRMILPQKWNVMKKEFFQ
jgi:hypothetical protein